MTGLTTHVLDTVRGHGASGLRVDVHTPDGLVLSTLLDSSGRSVLIDTLQAGAYELRFYVDDYQKMAGFYDIIPVRILVHDPLVHYHVPLILSAYGYSTYRGG